MSVEAAQRDSAEIRANPFTTSRRLDDRACVITRKGTYDVDSVVVTGAWTRKLPPDLVEFMILERHVLPWLQPTVSEQFEADRFPVFVHATKENYYYEFRVATSWGSNSGCHHFGETVNPNEMDQQPRPDD